MKKFKWLFIIIILLLVSGCWQYRELNDLAIVSAIGVDKIDTEYLVTVQVINTRKQSHTIQAGEETTVTIYEAKGKSIQEALNMISLECPKELYLGHIDIVVIGEETARTGIKDYIDFFLRDREVRKIYPFVFAKGAMATDVLKILPPIIILPGTNLANMIETADEINGVISNRRFDNVLDCMYKRGRHAGVTAIEIVNQSEKGDSLDNLSESKPKTKLMITGPAVMRDDKLVGFLNNREGFGYNIIRKQVKRAVITFPCDKDNNYGSVTIDSPKVKLDTKIKNNKPFTSIKIDIASSLTSYNCKLDLSKDKNITKVENMIVKETESIIKDVIYAAQKIHKTDVLSFDEKIYQNYYKDWEKIEKNWDEIFPTVKYEIKVNARINSIGSVINPAPKGGEKNDY